MQLTGRFKVPNLEVMADWARWITRVERNPAGTDVIDLCVTGPVSRFEERWPNFMQQHLDPKAVSKERRAASAKTPEIIYHVYLLGLLHVLRPKGWEISGESRAGLGYLDVRLISRKTRSAVIIEIKSSEKLDHIEGDASVALDQIVAQNYRNPEGLSNIQILREYDIACHNLSSCVKGRYLELNTHGVWEEKIDPAQQL